MTSRPAGRRPPPGGRKSQRPDPALSGVQAVVEIEEMIDACREHFLAREQMDSKIGVA